MVLMIFVDSTPAPRAVLRVTTDSERARQFKSAYDNLKTLRAALPSALVDSVPTPLLFETRNGLTCFLESAQTGTPIKTQPPNRYFRSRRFRRDFSAVVEWVTAFNQSLGVSAEQLSASQHNALLDDRIATYREQFSVSSRLGNLLDETQAALSGADLQFSPRHADFCTANVLMDPDHNIQVIDWEQPLTPTWLFSDLLHFMNSIWAIPYGRGTEAQEQNYRTLLFSETHLTDLLRQGTRRYAESLSIAPNLMTYLSVMAWVQHALQKADYVSQFAKTPDETEALMARVHHITIVKNNQCCNLEILAAERSQYIFDG